MKRKKTAKVLIPLASLALFFTLIPTVISTETGKKMTLSLINRLSSKKIEINHLSLSWLGSQKIEGLHYEALEKGLEVTCEEVKIKMSLFKMLFFSKDFNAIEITKPHLLFTSDFISVPSTKKMPLEASFFPKIGSVDSFKKDLSGFTGHILLKEGSLEVKVPGTQNVIFFPIEGEALLQKKDLASSLYLQVDTLQGDVKGYLKINGSLDQEITLKSSCSHFPLKGVDQIAALIYPRYEGALVNLIGPSLDMECVITSLDARLSLQSQNLKMNIQMTSSDEAIDLTTPASVQMTLTPESNKKLSFLFPDFPPLATTSPISLLLNIESLHLPIQEKDVILEKASFISSVSSEPYLISPMIKATLKGNLSSEKVEEKISAEFKIELGSKKNISNISLIATLNSPISKTPSTQATISTDQIPTILLDSFFAFPPSTFLGSWLQGTCQLTGDLNKANLSLNLTTPLFSLSNTNLTLDDKKISLTAPILFAYTLTQPVLDYLLGKDKVILQDNALTKINISTASFANDVFLDAIISTPTLSFLELFTLQNYSFPALDIHTEINTLSKIHIDAKNSLIALDATLGLDKKNLTLTQPLMLEYTLGKQDFLIGDLSFTLQDEAKVKLTCKPATFSLEGDLKKTKLETHLDVTPLHIQNKLKGKEITLQNIISDINFTGAKELVDFSFQLDLASSSPLQNSLKGSGSLQKILSNKDLSFFTVDLKTDHLSLSVLEDFYTFPFCLSALAGDTVTSSFHLEKTPTLGSFTIDAQTPLLKIKGSLALEKDKLFFPKNAGPFEIKYTLTPQGYKTLFPKKSPFTLKENALFTTSITELNIPYLPNTYLPDLTHTKIGAITFNEGIIFNRKGSAESLALTLSKISLQKQASQKDLTLNVDTKAKASSLPEGSLHLTLILSKFLNAEGVFNLSDLETSIQANATSFPSTALDIAFAMKKEPFTLFLGPSFEATLHTSLQNSTGPVVFGLRSPKAHLDLVGKMENGALKLTKDLKADLLITDDLGKYLLKQTGSSSIKSFYAPSPLTLQASFQGFSFPINSMDFSQIQIPSMRIDLGKLYCKNEGAMLSLLKQLKSKDTAGKDIQVWLAPMDLHIKQGVIDIERTEILLDKTYDVAIWGGIDLPNNYVDMIFGLTADALKQAFGIKELPSSYVLKIPIKGTLDNIQIKSGVATSKITALLLWQSKALDNLVPFGGVLKKVIPAPGGEGKAPPPKTPFPWQR